MPVRRPGPTHFTAPSRYRSPIATHSGRSWGTVEETITPSRPSRCIPRSASRLRRTAPSSSAVDSRTVAKRQCWTSAPSRKVPRWVWVLPASTTRSMDAHIRLAPAVAATLYAVPASHPCAAVERALELKGIAYRRVDLPPVAHKGIQQALFGGGTVPGLALDGRRILGSRPIIRALDE